jgi:hypothetical protein
MIGIQTRLIVKGDRSFILWAWAFITSLIWCYLLRNVILDNTNIIPYSLGTSIGAVIGSRINKYNL